MNIGIDTDALSERDETFSKGGYPKRTPVVLGTIRPRYVAPKGRYREPDMEYRIGIVFAEDLTSLCCPDIIQYRLNPIVARKCFGESPIYFDKNEAIAAARPLLAKASCGIKVRNFNERWPGVSCTILNFPSLA